MNNISVILITALLLMMAACAGLDPNELNITDNMDFKTSVVDTASSNIIVDVIFYDIPELGSLLFYIDSDNVTGADYVVTCRQDSFTVNRHDTSPGELLHQGTPVFSASLPRYTFSFPASVLGLSSGTTVNYWFAWVGGDRMPDRPESIQMVIP